MSNLFAQSKFNNFDIKGNKIGKWITYDFIEGDSLKFVDNYDNGKLNGNSFIYYPNGEIKQKIFFKNGLKQGKCTGYYKNGEIEYYVIYKKNKVLLFIKFLSNGEIFQESYNGKTIQYEKGKPIN